MGLKDRQGRDMNPQGFLNQGSVAGQGISDVG